MTKYLPYAIYLLAVATGIYQMAQGDWPLILFGVATLVSSTLTALLTLAIPMAMQAALLVLLNSMRVEGLVQRAISTVSGFVVTSVAACAYCAVIFQLCFASQRLPIFDPTELSMKLLWVGAISICPWATLTAKEARFKSVTPLEELSLAVLLFGCAETIYAVVTTHTAPSWYSLFLAYGAPLLGGAIVLANIAASAVRGTKAANMENSPADERVTIRCPHGHQLRLPQGQNGKVRCPVQGCGALFDART